MITYSLTKYDSTEIAKFRLKAIKFHSEFSAKATLSAFLLKRSTLFLWKKKLKECMGETNFARPQIHKTKKIKAHSHPPGHACLYQGVRGETSLS